jgi:tRNA threonylcarbamoyladenosine biosynthesis protein TsaE
VGDVVALSGPLGAGKTTFVQGLAEGLEVPSERHVASPTFALVNEHPGRVDLVHVDFYRVASPAELPELGLEEAYDRAVTAVEWAERFLDWLPTSYLHITIEPQRSGERVLCIASHGLRNEALALEILEDGLR